ncbi:uncharacterized protein LOC119373339 [Rhipicephalus sanguineus]|uniref:uncharacterized protein LOC119373339 n=1 Tax=Rhipicephalus sanguineus TaxID=34632 RepID=UPI0020C1F058|nr:uncharacterized protein LOC119373339 [Rhipicephalus sanguineus]
MVMAYMVTDRIFARPVPVNFVRVSQVIAADLLELISGAAPFCVVVYSSTYSVWLPGIAVAVHVVMASGARWCFLQGFQGFALVQEQALVAEMETMDDKACNLAIVLCIAFVFLGLFPCNLVVPRVRPPIFEITRRPVFQIGLHGYVSRPNGLLNFLEMVGGLVLFSKMSNDQRDSKAVRLLSSSACTFGVSGASMLMACISSPTCAYYLPRTLYYILFHGLGAICYLTGAFCVSQYTQEAPLHSTIGFCTGALHALHCAYASFKVYFQKSSSGWF